jgi:hypothetical protein
MPCVEHKPEIFDSSGARDRKISGAAQRALAEAAERRSRPDENKAADGRGGLDPARYGDWEVKGIASDF